MKDHEWLYNRSIKFANDCGTESLKSRDFEKLKKLYIEFATDVKEYQVTELRKAEKQEGWTIELPDLPYFQVRAFDTEGVNWESHIYDTKNLPVKLLEMEEE